MNKITIVGPGRVGESTAQIIAKSELCHELVLIGRNQGTAEGIALDIQETAPLFEFDTTITGTADFQSMKDSDLVIITAGLPRKPGMSRSDLLDANIDIIGQIIDHTVRYANAAKILIVSNPVDVLTYHAWQRGEFARNRIFGLSGVLDSTRMASFIATETGFSVKDINTLVIGGHGDAMVPLVRYATINGIPIKHFLDTNTINKLVEHTQRGGAEILALKQTSSAYDSPAASIATMVDAVALDRKRILPCVAILNGEYQQSDIAMGVPVLLGRHGVEKIFELDLTDLEKQALIKSAQAVRQTIKPKSIQA